MSITKTNILVVVNRRLQENFSASDIESQIQEVLDDLSEEDLLQDSDESQSLVSGGETLDEPTGFRALVAITLTITSSGSTQFPLEELKKGHKEYRRLRHNDSSTGIPRFFSRFNKKFFMWRPANQAFTALIEYYKNHPQGVDTIEFDDNFKNAIFAGATYYVAAEHKKTSYIAQWLPIYEDAKRKRSDALPQEPVFSEG